MQEKRYLVDMMLLRLGRWLRLMGQDVANPENESDEAILAQAKMESRTLITRDKGLSAACLSAGEDCILIQSSGIADQILEMADTGLALKIDPQRCTLCNGPLIDVRVDVPVNAEVDAKNSRQGSWQCPSCRKVYWQGGHWRKMEEMLSCIRSRRDREKAGREIG